MRFVNCVSLSPSQLSGDAGSHGSFVFVSVDHGSALMGSLACELLVALLAAHPVTCIEPEPRS